MSDATDCEGEMSALNIRSHSEHCLYVKRFRGLLVEWGIVQYHSGLDPLGKVLI